MSMRVRRGVCAAVLTLLAGGLAVGATGLPAVASADPSVPLPVASPVPPVVGADTTAIRTTVTTTRWVLARTSTGPSVRVSWARNVQPMPGQQLHYEVQTRYLQAGDRATWAEGWQVWLPSTTLTSVVLDRATFPDATWSLYPGAANEFRARVVDQFGAAGPWSPVASANIVMDDVNAHNDRHAQGWYDDLNWSSDWHTSTSSAYYFGTQHVTSASRAYVGGGDVWGTRFALVGTRCASCGQLRIWLYTNGTVREISVDTYSRTTQHNVVIYETTIPSGHISHWVLENSATAGRPAIGIDGYGVGH